MIMQNLIHVVYFIMMIVRKRLFNKSTARSFVITQHEESIYERPDIKSIYRRIVML